MRTKDEEKKEALFEATIKVVNEIGFASSSVSKIAKEAGVSSSTLYVYHENKDDLIKSTYLDVKRRIAKAFLKNFDPEKPIRDIFRSLWYSLFEFASEHLDYFMFSQQFSNSPKCEMSTDKDIEKEFQPFIDVFKKGVEQKIIKDVNKSILGAYMFHPIPFLVMLQQNEETRLTDDEIEMAFTMAWDAMKL